MTESKKDLLALANLLGLGDTEYVHTLFGFQSDEAAPAAQIQSCRALKAALFTWMDTADDIGDKAKQAAYTQLANYADRLRTQLEKEQNTDQTMRFDRDDILRLKILIPKAIMASAEKNILPGKQREDSVIYNTMKAIADRFPAELDKAGDFITYDGIRAILPRLTYDTDTVSHLDDYICEKVLDPMVRAKRSGTPLPD